MTSSRVHRVTITLEGAGTRRVVDVPDDRTLAYLDRVIRAAMGWAGTRPHEWLVDGRPPPDDGEGTWLVGALVGRAAEYRYGLWRHLLHVAPGRRPSALPYPLLIMADGACPPEECEGPQAYARTVAALADIGSDAYDEALSRLPDGFDPGKAQLRDAARRVAALQDDAGA